MALTRHRWFFVMSRNSSFVFKGRAVDHGEIAAQLGVRYLLEGSIRRSAYRVRVAATLSDAASGTAMWSESYDRELADILAIQEEIAARVAGALEPELLKAEGSRAARAVGDLGAWDLVRQGTWYFHQVTEATSVRARQLFREAVRKDPQLCEAHMWLARVSVLLAVYGWVDDVAGVLNEAHRAALRAIELDERDPYSHYALSMACMYSHAHDAAIRAARRCIELNPSFALGHAALGQALLCAGLAAHALEPIEYGLRLNPYDPQNFHWWRILAVARLLRGENDRALEAALRALDLRPSWRLSLDTALLCYAALKRWKEAAECIAEIEMSAQVKSDPIAVLGLQHPQWDALRRDALAHAGVAAQ
jgi:tetratricopeptide (TPR) repeat protein